jgi:hypothetical protein
VTVRRGPRRAAPHPYARVVHPRVDRAVLAGLVGQSTYVINPRQAATHQSATRFAPVSRPWGRTPGTPSAVGVAGLPLGFAVEAEAIVEAAPKATGYPPTAPDLGFMTN